jgi:hypothetical protein
VFALMRQRGRGAQNATQHTFYGRFAHYPDESVTHLALENGTDT